MACDATSLQRRFFEVLNTNMDGINAACAEMAAEAFLSILSELETLFSIGKRHGNHPVSNSSNF